MNRHTSNWPLLPKPMKTRKRNGWDRIKDFGVHFFYGAVLGSVFGLGAWIFHLCHSEKPSGGLVCIAVGMGLSGLVAGIVRDEFWTRRRKPRSRSAPQQTENQSRR